VPAVMSDMENAEYLVQIKYQWYISEPGFPMRWDHLPGDASIGVSVPEYPKNFSLIAGAAASVLPVTPAMAGRHVACVMTPCAVSGKMGDSVVSVPQYIYGPAMINGLAAHYDASLIDDPSDIGMGGIARWRDLSNLQDNGADAWPNGGAPSLTNEEFPQMPDRDDPIKALSVAFNSGWMEPDPAFSLGNQFTMFAVVRINDINNGTIISNGAAWAFDPSAYDASIVYAAPDTHYILGLSSEGIRTIGKNARVDNTSSVSPVTGEAGGIIKIGSGDGVPSDINLTELIIYSRVLSPDEWLSVTSFLGEKYNLS